MIEYEGIKKKHLDGIIALCQAAGFQSYTEDADLTWQVLNAPGVTTYVAADGDSVVGFIQMQSDGHIQAHLSLILVDPNHRRKGIERRLIKEAFTHAGGKRIDLVTNSTDCFYRSFKHKANWQGYRIYPQKLIRTYNR